VTLYIRFSYGKAYGIKEVYDDVVGCLLNHEATKRERKKMNIL
jgi:hypothetical protein